MIRENLIVRSHPLPAFVPGHECRIISAFIEGCRYCRTQRNHTGIVRMELDLRTDAGNVLHSRHMKTILCLKEQMFVI